MLPQRLALRIILVLLTSLAALAPEAQAASITRASAFEYDPATGLLTKETIEPDRPELHIRSRLLPATSFIAAKAKKKFSRPQPRALFLIAAAAVKAPTSPSDAQTR